MASSMPGKCLARSERCQQTNSQAATTLKSNTCRPCRVCLSGYPSHHLFVAALQSTQLSKRFRHALKNPSHRRPTGLCHAGAMDVMPAWTLDQIVGLVFGAVMVAAVLSARQVDVMVARAQRRDLGLCEKCGGVFEPGKCQQRNCPSKHSNQP